MKPEDPRKQQMDANYRFIMAMKRHVPRHRLLMTHVVYAIGWAGFWLQNKLGFKA